ncbi:WXG100 family type VII secretion target [Amycolatopsis jiangsuensis]|uniref:PPE family protein n=1 Tax=Amycolatopsis jiangsuensis TaxID=1181879 RepID=A0A840IVS9_9PSEU|nr:hypothetical protein [Amycolatopsis jiangsuensis]MBB4685312.1 hypothetical protein [Amycolatopsis jiangsuensis]
MDFAEAAKEYFAKLPGPVPIEEIVSQVLAGDTGGWHEGATAARELATEQEALSQDLSRTLAKLESTWSGQSSELAASRMQKLRASTIDGGQTFTDNGGTHTTGISMHDALRNRLTPLPPKPGLAPGSRVDWYDYDMLSKVTEYNDTAQQNLELYQDFTTQTQGNSQQLKTDYGTIGAYDGGDVTIDRQSPGPQKSTGGPGPNGPSGGAPTAPGSTPGPGTAPATQHLPGQDPSAPGTGAGSGTGSDQTTTAGSVPPSSGPLVPGGGNGPNGYGPGSGPGSGPGFAGGFGGAGAAGGGIAARLGGGGGTSARFGSGGTAGGPEAGPGARSGSGAGESAASRVGGGRGTAGAKGMSGAAAPGGQRGKKEEDEEHERKYVLDVDLFADDDKAVDPATGMRPVPPTLGA